MAYHQEAESIPNGLPAGRTVWVLCGLTMSGNNRPRCLTHSTPTDKRLNSGSTDWHHGNLYICGQPITVIVSRSVVALLVYVTKKVWHGGETSHTRSRRTEILSMRSIVTLNVQQTVASPQSSQIQRTVRYFSRLAVDHQVVTFTCCCLTYDTRGAWLTR